MVNLAVRNEVIFGNVNDDIRFYFQEFGKKVAHESMCKPRMRMIFNQALQNRALTNDNRNLIMDWHNQNPT